MTSPSAPLTKEDFDRSEWEGVIAGSARKECDVYRSLFLDKARQAEVTGDGRSSDVFALLSNLTSLHLRPYSVDEPFGPMWELTNSRSAIPNDFSEEDLDTLKQVAPEANDPEMRARIADVLWVRSRDFRMAQLAVTSYLEAADILGDLDRWVPYGDRVERAIRLAASLGRAGDPFKKTVDFIEGALDGHDGEQDPSFPLTDLMRLLQDYGQGDPAKYGGSVQSEATRAEAENEWAQARAYWEIRARWSQMEGDEDGRRQALVKAAETYVKESEEALNRTPPSYLVASSHLTRAIEGLRRAGGQRERVEELRHVLLGYQRQRRNEMVSFSGTLDLTEFVERAENRVKGKPFVEALVALATSCAPPEKSKLRQQVEENSRGSIMSIISMDVVNDAGRVVARRPSRLSNIPEEVQEAARADMFSQATVLHEGYGASLIEPARKQINLEHNVGVSALLPFVSNNPFVPEGRELIYAQGLHYGLKGNLLVAAHLLIPQIEHSVRHVLSESGVLASTLRSSGIQEERNLNQTLYEPKLEELWGEDIVFDLQGLLVERFGSNLRNKMAHGLMGPESFSSYSVLYLWWITLYICYAHLAVQHSQGTDGPPESEEGEGATSDEED